MHLRLYPLKLKPASPGFEFVGIQRESLRDSVKSHLSMGLQSISRSSFEVVEISGIEPLTSCLQGRRSPSWAKPPYHWLSILLRRKVVGQSGLEPPTSRLSVVCSSQLSYWPVADTGSVSLASVSRPSSLISPCLLSKSSPFTGLQFDPFGSLSQVHLPMYPLNWIT